MSKAKKAHIATVFPPRQHPSLSKIVCLEEIKRFALFLIGLFNYSKRMVHPQFNLCGFLPAFHSLLPLSKFESACKLSVARILKD